MNKKLNYTSKSITFTLKFNFNTKINYVHNLSLIVCRGYISTNILEAIKASFKSKPITITVEEELDTTAYLKSSTSNKIVIEKSLLQAKNKEFIEVKL